MTSTVSEFDRAKMGDIVAGHGDWFDAQLYRLIAKADDKNFARLRLAFPEQVQAYLDWYTGPGDDDD